MPLTKLQFKAGIVSDITVYSNEGGFIDGDKVRFRLGYPEKIGGWAKYTTSTYLGSARRLHNWVALDGSDFLGVGTNLKYYIEEGQAFNDVTPIRNTTGAGDVTFSASVSENFDSTGDGANDSTLITVNDPAHGANANDFVTFSGVNSVGLGSGGNITQAILQSEFQITSLISSNAYKITANVLATTDDDETGGSSITGAYQINVGLDNTVGGTGWGAGQWSGTTSNAVATTINEGGIFSNSNTTLIVTSSNPTHQIATNDVILIENELMLVTNVATNDLTVVRAYAGSGAASNVNTANHGSSSAVTDAVTHADGTLVRLAVGNADSDNDFVGWGNAASVTISGAQIRLWSHDNFGEDLIMNPRDGALYYWDRTTGFTTRAIELSTKSGTKTSVPRVAKQILVSDQDRHVIAFGCDGFGSNKTDENGDGVQDPLLVRFSSQENPIDWFPTATNTAGDLRLGGGSTFVQAVETKQQILIFTNKSLHSMKFIGPPFTFGLQELSKNITIMSPSSAIAVEDAVFWMGVDTFYVYAGGQTAQLPCTVKDKVFLDFNFEERDKVHVGVNSEFSELLWFYPSSAGTEVDKYVAYNYSEKIWYYGTMARQAWLDRGIRTLPIATGSQYLYNHEVGYDDDGAAMTSFIESAPVDIGDGDKFVFLKRVIPDITFDGSTATNPDVSFTMKTKNFPGSSFSETTQKTTQRSATSPVELFTEKLDYRLRGRSFSLRIDSTSLGTKYKLGSPRVDIRADGRR